MRELLTCVLLVATAAAQQGPQPIGEVQGADANVRGAVTVGATGTILMSGSQVSAGANPATIKLVRGGELRVCAGGSITITASVSGREALVGLNTGAIETHYRLSSSADTVMTPDFRLLLPGPGDFHFAIALKGSGDMCVKSLPGNSSAMIVHEVFGEGTHQVRPGDGVVFQKGSVQNPIPVPAGEECGCASVVAVRPVVEKPVVEKPEVKPMELGFPEQQSQRAAAAIAAGEPPPSTAAALPGVSTDKNEVITKVDAPIVFRGEDLPAPKREQTAASSAPGPAVEKGSPAATRPDEPKVEAKAAAEPAPPPPPVKKKWYQRLGSALAKLFR